MLERFRLKYKGLHTSLREVTGDNRVTEIRCQPVTLETLCPVQILGFDWKNCGQPDDPSVLKSLELSPDPITIPGDLKASASGSTSVELSTPLAVSSGLGLSCRVRNAVLLRRNQCVWTCC